MINLKLLLPEFPGIFGQVNQVPQEVMRAGLVVVLFTQVIDITIDVVNLGWPVLGHILVHRWVVQGVRNFANVFNRLPLFLPGT